jgi:putative transposase
LNDTLLISKPEIPNSDPGALFTMKPFVARSQDVGVCVSMDGRGSTLDNVFTVRFWRSVKYEDIYPQYFHSPPEVIVGLTDCFRFFNHKRPHQSLEYRTPFAKI